MVIISARTIQEAMVACNGGSTGKSDHHQEASAEATNQKTNADLCGKTVLTTAAGSGLAGGKMGYSAGKKVCVSTILGIPLSYPGCVGAATAGGVALGTLGGLIAALNTASCQNSTLNAKLKPTGPKGSPFFSAPLGKCPSHGVAHSCPDNPTPTRGHHGGKGRVNGRNCGNAACAPSCGGSSGGCGCGC